MLTELAHAQLSFPVFWLLAFCELNAANVPLASTGKEPISERLCSHLYLTHGCIFGGGGGAQTRTEASRLRLEIHAHVYEQFYKTAARACLIGTKARRHVWSQSALKLVL